MPRPETVADRNRLYEEAIAAHAAALRRLARRSPAPLIAFALLLVFVWIAFGKEARAVERKVEKLGGE